MSTQLPSRAGDRPKRLSPNPPIVRMRLTGISRLMVSHKPTPAENYGAKPIRVLLAGGYTLVRAGTRALLGGIDGVEVIAESGDEHEILRLIEELRPDVVLLDLPMPEINCLELLQQTTKRFPEVHIITVTTHGARNYTMRALRAGAAGFLPPSATSRDLEEAIRTVYRGEVYCPENTSTTLIGSNNDTTEQGHVLDKLTPRQREVLKLIATGYSSKAIGLALNVSVKTVESHRANLMERINIHDVAGLVRYAIRMSLVDLG